MAGPNLNQRSAAGPTTAIRQEVGLATEIFDGLMSAQDKAFLDTLAGGGGTGTDTIVDSAAVASVSPVTYSVAIPVGKVTAAISVGTCVVDDSLGPPPTIITPMAGKTTIAAGVASVKIYFSDLFNGSVTVTVQFT